MFFSKKFKIEFNISIELNREQSLTIEFNVAGRQLAKFNRKDSTKCNNLSRIIRLNFKTS